jgi:probable rRNA maturation factor
MREARGRIAEVSAAPEEATRRLVFVNNCTKKRLPLSRKEIGRCALLVLGTVDAAVDELGVTFLDDAGMRALNRKYAGKNHSTDVLAFMLSGPPGHGAAGDVYISLERAVSQAREYGVGMKAEILRLLVHGILHLAGYRDDRQPARGRMTRVQEKLVNALLEPEPGV